MEIILTRQIVNNLVTLGRLTIENYQGPAFHTLELPWRDNQRNISCIPVGRYRFVPHNSAKYKDVWRLENVPGRDGILIHAGNTVSDIQGCILVGNNKGELHGRPAVLASRLALDRLRTLIGGKSGYITIREAK